MAEKAPQDLAPKGGYPSIRFARNLPRSTISAAVVGVGITLLSVYGMFQAGNVWRERRELKREKMWARLYLLPMLQAEMDREWMSWRAGEIAKEAEIMKDVPGWVAGQSPYNNSRWAPPRYDLDGNPIRPPLIRWVDSGEPL